MFNYRRIAIYRQLIIAMSFQGKEMAIAMLIYTLTYHEYAMKEVSMNSDMKLNSRCATMISCPSGPEMGQHSRLLYYLLIVSIQAAKIYIKLNLINP